MIRVSKREAPSPNQRATSTVVLNARLYLNTFRGEPAISRFAWHFTAIHKSSQPFVTDPGSGLHACIPRASPCSWIDHLVSGLLDATARPFGLAFAPAPPVSRLNLATPTNSLAHSTKGTPSPPYGGSDRPEAHGFRFCFTPRQGVLFTVPSRYWCTIGRRGYLALGRGRPCFPPDFACPAVLTFMTHPAGCPVTYRTLTFSGPLFQYGSARSTNSRRGPCRVLPPSRSTPPQQRRQPRTLRWFGLLPVRSPLLRESSLFLGVREMFQFPRFPPPLYARGPLSPAGVAPFGFHRIIGCQHLPCAFRRVATSFIGPWRLGIHRVPFFDYVSRHHRLTPWVCVFVRLRGARGDVRLAFAKRHRHARGAGRATSVSKVRKSCQITRANTRPAIGGAAGIRTPDLRRARAALSQTKLRPHALDARRSRSPKGVGAPGLEPGTSALSGPRSNHLSYAPIATCADSFPAHQGPRCAPTCLQMTTRPCAEDEAKPTMRARDPVRRTRSSPLPTPAMRPCQTGQHVRRAAYGPEARSHASGICGAMLDRRDVSLERR